MDAYVPPPAIAMDPRGRRHPDPIPPPFPADQVFLWLPGQAGAVMPFCSCYERIAASPVVADPPAPPGSAVPHFGSAPADYAPPQFLFHPVPVTHFLSIDELEELARNVKLTTRADPMNNDHLLSILRAEQYSHIVWFLARMGALAAMPTQRG
jgi:hypothetical protein